MGELRGVCFEHFRENSLVYNGTVLTFWSVVVHKCISEISHHKLRSVDDLLTISLKVTNFREIQMNVQIFFFQRNAFENVSCKMVAFCLSLIMLPGFFFKNIYELLNLRALKISTLYKNCIIQCMGKIFCVEFQRFPLKFHTKYLTHTLKLLDLRAHKCIWKVPPGPHSISSSLTEPLVFSSLPPLHLLSLVAGSSAPHSYWSVK